MINLIVFLLIFLFIVAAIARDDFAFILLYMFTGAIFIGRWWSRNALSKLSYKRVFDKRAFPNQVVPVILEVTNQGLLPLPWLHVQDGLSVEIRDQRSYQEVISLPGKSRIQFEYELKSHKRGLYRVGPLRMYTGDILGIGSQNELEGPTDHLTVYPKVIPLTRVPLPSRSPMGTLRTKQLIYEDLTRIAGKREYVAGDSLRQIDWKASAVAGRLQVKKFEPSIDLETAIFLNLYADDYNVRTRILTTELGIVIAASLATWVSGQKQPVGLWTNGSDPLAADGQVQQIESRKGQGHLMRILEVLARIKLGEDLPFIDLINQQSAYLGWGTTMILITSKADDALFDQLFRVRRAGQNIVLILAGAVPDFKTALDKAKYFGIQAYHFENENDLDIWRQ
ncbi:MAG: DUF58 domain-containing protein [Anaerolineales bacterium]|nr:DUF58 domain-containing protein [Anaerolineales bacterium]